MPYLNDAIQLAISRGYFAYPEVARAVRCAPKWLHQLRTAEGIAALSRRLGKEVPPALLEFYSHPEVLAFLELTGDETYFRQYAKFDEALRSRPQTVEHLPIRLYWDDNQYIGIQNNAHAGSVLAARIDQADPTLANGEPFYDPDDPNCWNSIGIALSEWLFQQIATYETKLDRWEHYIRECDSKRKWYQFRERIWFRWLPGMRDRLVKHKSG